MGYLKNLKLILLVALLPLGFLSCTSLSSISIDVMRPAEYSVPPDLLSAVVLDFSYPHSGDSVHKLIINGVNTPIDTVRIDDFGLRVANSMVLELDNRMFFDSVYLHPVSLNKGPAGRPGVQLSRQQIADIIDEYNAHLVIAVEGVSYNTEVKVIDLGGYYYSTLDAFGEVLWRIYDRYGDVLDEYLQNDSIYWDNRDTQYSSNLSAMPSLRNSVESLADFMGRYYPDRISPFWEKQRRYYYSSGHHLFSRANDLIKAHNWESAARVWYYVFEEGNKKQKAISAFNIALSYEIRGDFAEAAAWADKSRALFQDLGSFSASSLDVERANRYYNELNERIKEAEKLQEQVGLGL
ncbi:MAG TPA: hypothetical protein DEG09_08490 [Marinilabiliaceae bacterium]|nr:hypothetical protein [Marinilabiliaceae bacterium]